MEFAYVTAKGQVAIPLELRKQFGIKKGTRINFFEAEGGIKMVVAVTPEVVEANKGILKTKGKLLKALMDDKKREREF